MAPPNRIEDAGGSCLTTGEYIDARGRVTGYAAFEDPFALQTSLYSEAEASALPSLSTDARSAVGYFRNGRDLMTGGNRTHNNEARFAVGRVQAALDEFGVSVDPEEIERMVHQELVAFKDNSVGQRNGNVPPEAWPEIIEHVTIHFSRRGLQSMSVDVVETSALAHQWIDRYLDEQFSSPENQDLWSERGLDEVERLRFSLRTELRAAFQRALGNWGVSTLEDLDDMFRHGVAREFEEQARGVVSGRIVSMSVCSVDHGPFENSSPSSVEVTAAPVTTNAAPQPVIGVVRTGWEEVLTDRVNDRAIYESLARVDRILAAYYREHVSPEINRVQSMSALLANISPQVASDALQALTAEGRSVTQARGLAIFELVARSAEARGEWHLDDPSSRPRLAAAFEADLRRSVNGGAERLDRDVDRDREEREARERRDRRIERDNPVVH